MKGIPLSTVFQYSVKSSTSYISKLVQSGVISYESFLILDSFLDIINKHDEIATDFVWNEFSKKLNAYRKLVEISDEEIVKYRNLMKQTLTKLNEK